MELMRGAYLVEDEPLDEGLLVSWSILEEDMPVNDKLVLALISKSSEGCVLGNAEMAELLGMSTDMVKRSVASLKVAGLIYSAGSTRNRVLCTTPDFEAEDDKEED